jgi:GNAT superfamily N-acetyltransferase
MALNWITRTLTEGYVVVAEVSGRLVGTLALTNFQFPYSPQWYMQLEWLFVQKSFRSQGAFHALMKAAHAFVDERQAPLLAGVLAADADVMLKDKLFTLDGYEYMGGEFIRRARSGKQKKDNDTDVHAALVG